MDAAPLEFMVRKLRTRGAILEHAADAIRGLPHTTRTYDPSAYLVREGAIQPNICSLIVSGYAFRQKLTVDGAR